MNNGYFPDNDFLDDARKWMHCPLLMIMEQLTNLGTAPLNSCLYV